MPNIEQLTEFTSATPNGPRIYITSSGEPIGTHEPAKVAVTKRRSLWAWIAAHSGGLAIVYGIVTVTDFIFHRDGRYFMAALSAAFALAWLFRDWPGFRSWLRRRKAERVYRRWMINWYTGHAIGENVFGYEKHRNAAISSARRASGLSEWEPGGKG